MRLKQTTKYVWTLASSGTYTDRVNHLLAWIGETRSAAMNDLIFVCAWNKQTSKQTTKYVWTLASSGTHTDRVNHLLAWIGEPRYVVMNNLIIVCAWNKQATKHVRTLASSGTHTDFLFTYWHGLVKPDLLCCHERFKYCLRPKQTNK